MNENKLTPEKASEIEEAVRWYRGYEDRKERPILFSTEMVQAILAGRKTMTRRIIEPQPSVPDGKVIYPIASEWWIGTYKSNVFSGHSDTRFKCPYGKVGDVLWVRETCVHETDGVTWAWVYKADMPNYPMGSSHWKPSIHMPKSAARIWLEITGIRVERLQDISEADAIAEGIEFEEWTWGAVAFPDGTIDYSMKGNKTKWYRDYSKTGENHWNNNGPKESFKTLWDSINGPDSWDQNPWVWVVSFKVLSKTGKPLGA